MLSSSDIYIIKNRLFKKRKITDSGCWEWLGSYFKTGYGAIMFNYKQWRVHRLSFKVFKPDEYSENLLVLHDCDNKKCFNPDHLYKGTNLQNTRDAIERGRLVGFKLNRTRCLHGHDLTPENTYTYPSGRKECRICRKYAEDRWYFTKSEG